MDGSADVAWALTAWPTPTCAPVLALPSACAAFARLGCGGCGLGGGSGRRGLGGERSGGCDGCRGDRKRRGRLVGCRCRGSGRRRRCGSRDGNGNGVGRHHGRSILRRLGLIGCRGSVAGRCLRRLVGLRAIGLRRVGLRFGAAGGRGLGVGIGLGIGIGLGVDFVVVARLSSRALSLRALAAALRSFESLRAALSPVRCGSIVARAVVGRGLRIVGAARGGRVVLGAIVVVAGGRIAVDQRREAVVSGGRLGIRPGGPCRRVLKRCVCRYF